MFLKLLRFLSKFLYKSSYRNFNTYIRLKFIDKSYTMSRQLCFFFVFKLVLALFI